jgi:hypothetical protein
VDISIIKALAIVVVNLMQNTSTELGCNAGTKTFSTVLRLLTQGNTQSEPR